MMPSYRRLEHYTEAKELCAVLLDALKVHEKAWTSAGVLHGDVCDDNILIGRERTSEVVLIDWDMCKSRLEYTMNVRRAVGRGWRSGSWLFKSAVLSRYPLKDASVPDDIEAFMHLAHWFAVRFHRHMLKGSELHRHLQNFFLGVEAGAPCHRGTVTRYTTVKKNNLGIEFDHSRLQALLDTLGAICKEHYATFTEDQLRDWTPPECQETKLRIAVGNKSANSGKFAMMKRFTAAQPPPPEAGATLNSHQYFLLAFEMELENDSGWDSKDKLEDKFANLPTNDGEQTVIMSSHQPTTSTSSKRASREDPDVDPASQAPTAKRARVREEVTVTTLPVPKLDCVFVEEEELVD